MQLTPLVVTITPSVVHDLLNFKVHGFHFNREALLEGGALKASVVLLRTCGAWLLGLGFIGLAERFVKKDHFVIRYISDASYWIFYAHMIFTFSLSFLLTKLDVLNSVTKAYLLLVVCFYFLWWTYNAFVRYSWLGDFFMGKRKVRTGEPASNHFATSILIKQTWRPVLIGLLAVYVLGTGLRQQSLLEQKPFLNEAQIARDPLFFEQAGPLDEVRDPYGRTALHLAASAPGGYRDYNPIEKLLPHFKHPDVLDMMRRTPLFNASRKGNMEDVRLLLAAGADPNLPDRYGHTAAHASAIKLHLRDPNAASVHRRILNLLQEHGADMTLKDARGRTVRDLETRL